MQNGPQQWINDERPSDDPDYQRLIDVTRTVEAGVTRVGPTGVLNRRFDYDTAFLYGMRRTEETSQQVKLENPDFETVARLLGAAWPEGFVFGCLAFTQERRGRRPEPFLDRVALANVNQKLASASEADRSAIFSATASARALGFVGGLRSVQAAQILQKEAPVADHGAVKAIVASHWLDGFLAGLVFEELGGHREK